MNSEAPSTAVAMRESARWTDMTASEWESGCGVDSLAAGPGAPISSADVKIVTGGESFLAVRLVPRQAESGR
jgi:hypothetical protein